MRFLRMIFGRRSDKTPRQTIIQIANGCAWILGVIGLFCLILFNQPYRLAINNTWSMPYGLWYYKKSDSPTYRAGQTVITRYTAPRWVTQRVWSDKLHRRLIKDVRGVPGDHLRVLNGVISNCGQDGSDCRRVAERVAWDSHKDHLYFVPLPTIIPPDRYLLIGENPMSLDSRYLGLFSSNSIMGVAHSLLTWSIPEKAKQASGYQVGVSELPVNPSRWVDLKSDRVKIPKDDSFIKNSGIEGWSYYDDEGHRESIPFSLSADGRKEER